MRDARAQIEARGARLFVIGNGQPEHARAFAEQHTLSGAVFTDPERAVYKAAGLTRSVGATFSFATLRNGARAFSGGFRQARTQGDPWQQGGTLVIRPPGEVVFRYASQAAGDYAGIDEILESLRT